MTQGVASSKLDNTPGLVTAERCYLYELKTNIHLFGSASGQPPLITATYRARGGAISRELKLPFNYPGREAGVGVCVAANS